MSCGNGKECRNIWNRDRTENACPAQAFFREKKGKSKSTGFTMQVR